MQYLLSLIMLAVISGCVHSPCFLGAKKLVPTQHREAFRSGSDFLYEYWPSAEASQRPVPLPQNALTSAATIAVDWMHMHFAWSEDCRLRVESVVSDDPPRDSRGNSRWIVRIQPQYKSHIIVETSFVYVESGAVSHAEVRAVIVRPIKSPDGIALIQPHIAKQMLVAYLAARGWGRDRIRGIVDATPQLCYGRMYGLDSLWEFGSRSQDEVILSPHWAFPGVGDAFVDAVTGLIWGDD